jgi:adenylate/nucleoside-diphosphate kinase
MIDSVRIFIILFWLLNKDQMANMEQSFLIELNANLPPIVLTMQLFSRLQAYSIPKAARVLRIHEPIGEDEKDEQEENDAIETETSDDDNRYIDHTECEESLTLLQSKRLLLSKFKWNRSKCSYYCPVNLRDGRITAGREEFAAAFLDKIYMMANEKSLNSFLKNPRPYLKLPQPRAPCKLSILGSKYAGKTTLAALLSRRYNANVIDVDELVKPAMKKAKEELLERTESQAKEAIIEEIKSKFKEKIELEKS